MSDGAWQVGCIPPRRRAADKPDRLYLLALACSAIGGGIVATLIAHILGAA